MNDPYLAACTEATEGPVAELNCERSEGAACIGNSLQFCTVLIDCRYQCELMPAVCSSENRG